MRSYDPKEGRYKDQSIGDTPKIYTIAVEGKPTKVVGVGCKNGGFYVLQRLRRAASLDHTPIYTGPPTYPLSPEPDRRMLALPSCIGGLQTGCATDGQTIFTNGIDALRLGSQEKLMAERRAADGRARGGDQPRHARRNAGGTSGPRSPRWAVRRPSRSIPTSATRSPRESPWPTASSISPPSPAASSSPSTPPPGRSSRRSTSARSGRAPRSRAAASTSAPATRCSLPLDYEAFFPKKSTGVLYSFGLPGDDEVSRMGAGTE